MYKLSIKSYILIGLIVFTIILEIGYITQLNKKIKEQNQTIIDLQIQNDYLNEEIIQYKENLDYMSKIVNK
jgi:hypothetical protein